MTVDIEKLKALALAKQKPKCDTCKGSGMVTIHHPRLWMPKVCWCSACNGTGRVK